MTIATKATLAAALSALALLPVSTLFAGDDPSQALLDRFAAEAGTYADLQAKGDVEYRYTYRDNVSGKSDVSIERYLFDGELSWARFITHDKFVFPGVAGEPVQGFDGTNAWVTLGGKAVEAKEAVGLAYFLRKTNFYWFAMMQKLQDPGTLHHYEGKREHGGISYDLVKVTFDVPEGTKSDTYILYINPKTHLIDRFLFTVADFGVTEKPLLMEVQYAKFGKVMLPVTRRYTPSTWNGEVPADAVWTDELMQDIEFGNGFKPADFAPPKI